MKMPLSPIAVPSLLLSMLPASAQAHVFPGQAGGFANGFVHPFSGLDHLLAMVAVGIWASQLGGRALWQVPLSFIGVMALGAALAMGGVAIPSVEQGILLSVLVLGVLIAAAVRLPKLIGMLMVGLFATFHGHVHGTEMSTASSGFVSVAGLILATGLLHAFGVLMGIAMQKFANETAVRYAGATIVLGGLLLCVT